MGRIIVAVAFVSLAGCGMPVPAQGCSNVEIDWVDFIKIGSVQYVAGPGSNTTLRQSDLGPVISHVKFRVAGNVCDPNYRPKDGDAAFLDPGTPVYAVAGRPTAEAVAAEHDGQIVAYEAKSP